MPTVKLAKFLCNDSSHSGIPAILLFCIFLWVFGAFVPDFNLYSTAINSYEAAERYTTGNLGNQLFWGGTFLISVYLSFQIKPVAPKLFKVFMPLIILLSIALLSCSWSLEPGTSFRRVVLQIFVCYSLIAVIFTLSDYKVVLNILYKAFFVVLFYDLIAFFISPWDHFFGFPGIHGHKNSMAIIAAIALYVGVWAYGSGKRNLIFYAYFVCWSLLIIMSMSKTSIILLPIPLILYGISLSFKNTLKNIYSILWVGGFSLFLLIIIILSIGIDEFSLFHLISSLNNDELTGRGFIWKYMVSIIDENGLLGYGYAGFWGTESAANSFMSVGLVSLLNQAHNGYIDMLIQFGLLGYLLVLGFFIEMTRLLNRTRVDKGLYFFSFSLILFFVFHNLTESTLFRSTNVLWVMLLTIYFLSHKANLAKTN